MSWSIRYESDSTGGEYILIHNQEPNVKITVTQMREADAMHLCVALEQAKAKPVIYKKAR